MIKLSQESITFIENTSRERYPNEAVFGVLPDLSVIELDNIHPDPVRNFRVDSSQFYENECIALIHSHTVLRGERAHPEIYIDPRSPSCSDIATYLQMGEIPWGILAVGEDALLPIVWLFDYDDDILGKEYISGINDCHSVILRYYWQNFKHRIPMHVHDATWFETDPTMYENNFSRYGFKEVENNLNALQKGDVLLIRLFHESPTHAAVYTGDGMMVHHMANRLSCEERVERWAKRITKVLRLV